MMRSVGTHTEAMVTKNTQRDNLNQKIIEYTVRLQIHWDLTINHRVEYETECSCKNPSL